LQENKTHFVEKLVNELTHTFRHTQPGFRRPYRKVRNAYWIQNRKWTWR